jgi:hypothetical protein
MFENSRLPKQRRRKEMKLTVAEADHYPSLLLIGPSIRLSSSPA